jgi:hypothetical protein
MLNSAIQLDLTLTFPEWICLIKSPVTFKDIRKQIIWGNKHITFENKPIVFENWIKSDLIYEQWII